MTDQELNEAVARKMGLNPHFFCPGPNDSPSNMITRADGFSENLPDYCHSIVAAWEILERYGFALSKHPGGYTCELQTSGSLASSIKCEHASADIAPLAICKASLKLP